MQEEGIVTSGKASGSAMENLEVQPEVPGAERKEEFENLFEESLNQLQEGDLVQGRVVQVGKEHVMVDVGYKCEGQIPIQEFQGEDGKVTVREGDTIEVLLESRDDEEGVIVLSKAKADKIKVWEEVRRAYEAGGSVEGRIVGRVRGGLSVDIGVLAFLPGSQVDIRPVRNLERFIGQTCRFRVLKYNRRRSNIVLSRRALLEEERAQTREKTLSTLEEGMLVRGVVKNITEYGAFVDLGGRGRTLTHNRHVLGKGQASF